MKQILSSSFTAEHTPTLFRQQSAQPQLIQKKTHQDLYSLIVDHKMVKGIKIVEIYKEDDHESIFKNHIVNYVIEIKTDYFDYTIPKRYSEFEKLYEKVRTFMNQLPQLQKFMPKFPSKKVIQTNSRKTIASRKELLQQFLQYLLQQLDHSLYIFLEFLNIKEQFQKGGFDQNVKIHQMSKDENALVDLADISPKKIQPKNDAEQMIIHYLKKLNEKTEERGKIFQKMEKYYFGKTNLVSSVMFKLLLIGDEERELEGIITLLSVSSNDIQSHICCVHGLQFLRKFLEYDYNPCNKLTILGAEMANKLFSEISIKQFRSFKIKTHICGIQKLCKQDSLIILYKYISQNQLSDVMIRYLIDDEECLQEYLAFAQSYNNKKKDEVKTQPDSNDNLSELLPTKSNSIEHAILEQDPSIEQLQEISDMQLNWKFVQDFENHLLFHLQGQFVKTVHPIKAKIQKALHIFTDQKVQWFHGMVSRDVIEIISDNHELIVEYYVWEDMSTFKKMAFVSEEYIIKKDDYNYEIRIIPSQRNIGDYKVKCDQQGQKMSLLFVKQVGEDQVEVIIYQNIIDKTFRTGLTPVILKEIPWFNNTITKLKSLL